MKIQQLEGFILVMSNKNKKLRNKTKHDKTKHDKTKHNKIII